MWTWSFGGRERETELIKYGSWKSYSWRWIVYSVVAYVQKKIFFCHDIFVSRSWPYPVNIYNDISPQPHRKQQNALNCRTMKINHIILGVFIYLFLTNLVNSRCAGLCLLLLLLLLYEFYFLLKSSNNLITRPAPVHVLCFSFGQFGACCMLMLYWWETKWKNTNQEWIMDCTTYLC